MELFKREKYLKKIRPFYNSDIIKVITGIRRCGKSCIMKMIKDEIIDKGVQENQIIYIPLDSKKFKHISTPEKLEEKIDEYINDNCFYYLLIDEVQNVKGFEKAIQAFQEEGNCSIFLTGSNSYLLSDEISTKLTGRYINFEIYTLDFKEYIEMKKFLNKEIHSNLIDEFSTYITNGGFPKALEFDDLESKQLYTKSIIEEIFEKDIRTRNKIRNKEVFEAVRSYIINNYGATFSLNNVYEHFRNKEKINITKITLRNYIDILLKAKILYRCDRFDQRSKRVLKGEYKFYIADLALFFSLNTDNRINYGSSLENIVYLYLISNGYKLSIGKIGKVECDFITRDINNNYAYIQVSLSVTNEETEEREYRPFAYLRDGYPRYLLTLDQLRNSREGVNHLNCIDVFIGNEKI